VALHERAALIDLYRPWTGAPLPDDPEADALVVFGGEQAATDDDIHPYLPRLAALMAAYTAADKAEVKRLYSSDARLLSEFSPHEEVGWAGVAHYFGTVGLGPSPLRMHIDSQSQREFSDVMLVSGRYTLLRERWDGSIAEEASRFTLALRRTPDGQWQIAEQHSSRVPGTAR
jgi:ketosteroid isomerase-like protein